MSERCGTYAGAQQHRRAGEAPCTECRAAERGYLAGWRANRRGSRPALAPCGSVAAYRRHIRRGEEPCGPCRRAQAESIAQYRSRGTAGAA